MVRFDEPDDLNGATPHGPLDDLYAAVRCALPDVIVACVSTGDDRRDGDRETYLTVTRRHLGPYRIVTDTSSSDTGTGVFRWDSGPDQGSSLGLVTDPEQAVQAIAATLHAQ